MSRKKIINPEKNDPGSFVCPNLTDKDIFEAMKTIPGYLDITPADFKEIYIRAYQQAIERINRSVVAGDIMTRKVVKVKKDTPVVEAAAIMGKNGVSGVPVVDDGDKVLGVVSEKDILRGLVDVDPPNLMTVVAECLQGKKRLALPLWEKKAQEVMSYPAITIQLNTTLSEIAQIFFTRAINRAPVIDPNGRLVGLVSRGDLIKATRG